jgi:hypothetical protein
MTTFHTTPDNATLVAFLGSNAFPEGYWPNDDRNAFKAALAEYGLAHLNLVDDRAEPLSADDNDFVNSLAAYLENLSVQDA